MKIPPDRATCEGVLPQSNLEECSVRVSITERRFCNVRQTYPPPFFWSREGRRPKTAPRRESPGLRPVRRTRHLSQPILRLAQRVLREWPCRLRQRSQVQGRRGC